MRILTILILTTFITSCGMRSIPTAVNQVDASWAEVQNQYKRRTDLIPNLVNVVKGVASHEKETLTAVIQARANATKVTLSVDQLTPQNMAKFQKAQQGLSGALSKLMVVAERYPQIQANQNFRDLQVQLEGTENRITVARNRYIQAIKKFNNLVSVPPESWYNAIFLKHDKKPQFQVENLQEAQKAPEVKF
ncbi:MAG: LemA family protein [Epsilonproteobacteria bacterium]|nr:MAG: LemA family protein [Campylobacterota bacterium]RLA64296.1 MAG: LemA family protein [Campylobacterota bacterium]